MSLATVDAVSRPDGPALGELAGHLREQLARNRRRWQRLIVLEAVSLGVAAPLAYLWLTFLIDNLFHLPLVGRLLASAGLLASLVWVALRLVKRWRELHLTEDQVALAMERRTPGGVQNRLINAVQIARDLESHDRALSETVVRENYDRLQQIHLEQASRLRPAMIRLGLAGLAIVLGVGFWLWQPDQFGNAAARIFMPLADIDPLYRTVLAVEPGNVEASGPVTIRITIRGERPATLTILKHVQGKRTVDVVAVPEDGVPVSYTFRELHDNVDYAVHGGDYTTPYYRIAVARRPMLTRIRATFRYPEYVRLPERTSDSAGGDLEALEGARARVTFFLDQPVDGAVLVLEHPASAKRPGNSSPQDLTAVNNKEFQADIPFQEVLGYRLETRQGDRPTQQCGPYSLRVLKDQEPKLELLGIERRGEVPLDAVLPLRIAASDDFGLKSIGLFYRRSGESDAADAWQQIVTWDGKQQTSFRQTFDLAFSSLKIAEGEKLEIALQAQDSDPSRNGRWTRGQVYELLIGGDGIALQLQYEQIVRTEEALKELIAGQQKLVSQTAEWLGKLSGQGDIRWDDPKNIDMLHAAVAALGKTQEQIRKTAGQVAREMVPQAGNLRLAVGMLADTEMIRSGRIFDSVPTRDQPDAKRAALADGRLTQERVLRSLQEILEQYRSFRGDWELAHVIPFTKMLAERQTKLYEQTKKQTTSASDAQRTVASRRQSKLLDLCRLIQPAFVNVAERTKEVEPTLSSAFSAGAATLKDAALLQPMRQAAVDLKEGRWPQARRAQENASRILVALHDRLRQAQIDAARQALAALKERAKSDVEAQKELEKLDPGSAERFVKDYPDKFKVEDTIRLREVANAQKSKANPLEELDISKTIFKDVDRKQIELEKDSGVRQDTSTLRLGKVAEKTGLMPMYKGKDGNKVKPFIQEKFDDLVGKLLDEADELSKSYQSIKLSTNQNNNDPGEIGKIGGSLNSTGAVAATGNKKPPTLESGGVARTGRQGARAYGMVADDEGVDRRGRDKALEGKETIADQAGTVKMKKSDDMQKTTSTGVGGKRVESDDTHFSLADAGKWKDDMAGRMQKPQKKNYIVERQGEKIDARIAALLRDTNSQQEQIIERIKAIKKELKNLYLPTDHLDEIAAALQANLESLKDRPEAEVFRLQMQTLEKLRGALRVFRAANAGFQPSLPRERVIRGRVLDEPSRYTLPGYEEAVKSYYKNLASQ